MWARFFGWGGPAGVGLIMMALPETGWLGQEYARLLFWVGVAIATFCFIGWVVSSVLAARTGPKRGHWLPIWRFDAISLNTPPIRRLIPMKRAAQIAYEKTQGTVLAGAAEHTAREMKDDYDGILDYYAWALVGRGDAMDMWGRRPPSTRLKTIDGAKECPQCAFVDGGNSLKRYGDPEPRWTDIMVAKSQLRGRIKHIAEYG